MLLQSYRKKRNFKLTSEPYGKTKASKNNLYLIQKHAASHLHYDLRLELNGVLKSWAIPKGPSLDPSIKRLAIHVEDHPIEYGTFEGIIPKGQYGGGTVMLWDTGSWQCEDSEPNTAYKKGSLRFIIKGKKLKGQWHLVRIKNNPKSWLFIKANDKYARSEKEYIIIEKKSYSVLSHRSLEAIAHTNHGTYKKTQPRSNKTHNKIEKTIKKSAMPTRIYPELATLVDNPPIGDEWGHEIKYDGYRIISFINDKKIKLMTRNQKDWTSKFPSTIEALRKLNIKNAILDGELVALNKKGRSDFQLLQNYIHNKATDNLMYYVFDLPYYNGVDLTSYPLSKRKEQLNRLVPSVDSQVLYSEHIIGKGDILFKKACKLALEGIVSKNLTSPYIQNRSRQWLKIKCSQRQEFIVVGFTKARGNRSFFGALLLAVYTKAKQLRYCGNVGTGFNEESLKLMNQLLKQYKTKKIQVAKLNLKNITWVKPKLVIEVAFTEWTKKGSLRHPSFKGLRYDKKVKEIFYESKKSSSQT
ncbi:MAG: non-homologous end-joining DNA ligase [Rickettsia endosymbiont of Ixodes persulcatus]|nr:non-homologous end-joining DNA ligase [Rickettsia endosymbiont of Ixodes persulcatus]